MRYLIITYYKKPSGQIDEVMTVARNLKPRDHSTANVILDFKKLSVEKCTMNGVNVPRNFERIVEYYMKFYDSTITRLFEENGYQIDKPTSAPTTESNPS
jgi:hypothetical protein